MKKRSTRLFACAMAAALSLTLIPGNPGTAYASENAASAAVASTGGTE